MPKFRDSLERKFTGQLTNTVSADPRFVNYVGDARGNYQLDERHKLERPSASELLTRREIPVA
jgi:hypothetical protein